MNSFFILIIFVFILLIYYFKNINISDTNNKNELLNDVEEKLTKKNKNIKSKITNSDNLTNKKHPNKNDNTFDKIWSVSINKKALKGFFSTKEVKNMPEYPNLMIWKESEIGWFYPNEREEFKINKILTKKIIKNTQNINPANENKITSNNKLTNIKNKNNITTNANISVSNNNIPIVEEVIKDSDEINFITDLLNDKNQNLEDIIIFKDSINKIEYHGFFDEININDRAWEYIKNHKELKERLLVLIAQIENFYVNNDRNTNKIRKVQNNMYKIRLSRRLRIPFSIEENNSLTKLCLWEVLDHQEGVRIHKDGYNPNEESLIKIFDTGTYEIERNNNNNTENYSPLFRLWTINDNKRLKNQDSDLPWKLTAEQKSILDNQGPILLKGSAGSGKSTIAIYRLLNYGINPEVDKNIYVTYTEELKNFAKKIYYSLYSKINYDNTSFFTISELCKKILNNNNFPEENKLTFDVFCRLPFLGQLVNNIPPEIIWEEIRGIIKGAYQISDFELKHLTKEQYLNKIPKKQSLFPKNERIKIFNFFEKYENWKKEKGMWDELDLSIEAFKNINNFKMQYNQVVADEVQDFTTFELKILTHISSNPFGLFLTGDTQQIIHPTRFEWPRVKTFIYEHLSCKENIKPKVELKEIEKNFRSSNHIVEFCNNICEWRNKEFGERNTKLEPVFFGEPNSFLNLKTFKLNYSNNRLTANLMVIIASEESKKLASKYFPKRCLYTIHQAKGLEMKYVFLFNFFNDPTIDFHNTMVLNNSSKHRQLYISNLLNVSITRARKNLIIIDEQLVTDFEPINKVKFNDTEQSLVIYNRICSEKSTDEDYIKLALELEEKDILDKAAENYLEGKSMKNGHRCYGIFFERNGQYIKAAQHFENAEMINDAVRCFEKADQYDEAFKRIINFDIIDNVSDIQSLVDNYLTDRKKLAKLNGMAEIISYAINRKNFGIDLKVLFSYSINRTRLLDYEISLSVQKVNVIKIKELNKKFSNLI